MNCAQPRLDEGDEAHRIGATAPPLAGPLDKAAMHRTHNRGALVGQVVERALMKLDDLDASAHGIASGTRREPETIEHREQARPPILGSACAPALAFGELLTGRTASCHRSLRPIVSLFEGGGKNLGQQPVCPRLAIVGSVGGRRERKPGAARSAGRQGLGAHHVSFAKHIEVRPNGIEMQAEALGELVSLQRPFGPERLEQADPARAGQSPVRPPVERRQRWRDDRDAGVHALDFTRSFMVKTR
jgi:hypothetical protein